MNDISKNPLGASVRNCAFLKHNYKNFKYTFSCCVVVLMFLTTCVVTVSLFTEVGGGIVGSLVYCCY